MFKINHKELKHMYWFTAILAAALILLVSCKSGKVVTNSDPVFTGNEKLLILPFRDITQIYGEKGMIKCPICSSFFMAGEVSDESREILLSSLASFFKNNTDFDIIVRDIYPELMHKPGDENSHFLSDKRLIVRAGNSVKANAVVAGYIFRYRDRVGNKYSVETPASVSFGVHIIGVKDGRMIWSDHFDETQHSLSDNLFELGSFVKRKGSWITAEEMATTGLNDLLKRFKKNKISTQLHNE